MFKSNGEFWHTNTNALSNLDLQEIGKIGRRSNLRHLGAPKDASCHPTLRFIPPVS